MLNQIVVVGRLTRDPELRTTGSGVSVMSFTVAVERRFKQGDEKVTDFIECVAWRYNAEFLAKYAGKGRLVCVSGSLQSRKWKDKDGNNRTSWEIQADNVELLDRPKDGQQNGAGYAQTGNVGYGQGASSGFDTLTNAARSAGVPTFYPSISADEDVPF